MAGKPLKSDLFKILISIIAVGVHVRGFLHYEEPLPHEMFFCGTYFAYMLISIFAMAMAILHVDSNFLVEAVVTGVGAALFLIGSIVSMSHAENDFHLMYLSDKEEAQHEFFAICKTQSIVSLIAGLCFMLHSTFAIDVLLVQPTESELDLLQVSPADRAASGPIELVLFCKPWLTSFWKWITANKKARDNVRGKRVAEPNESASV